MGSVTFDDLMCPGVSECSRSLGYGHGLHGLVTVFTRREIRVRRTVDDPAFPREPRTVARTVPGLLRFVPVNDAPEVRTYCRKLVQGPGFVSVNSNLLKATTYQATCPGCDAG